MEDTLVKPGHMAYQFRVDINPDVGVPLLKEWMKKYDTKYYICGEEVSDQGKPHFQCVLWFETKVNTTKLRNWWKGKTLATKQPVSMTSAKKIRNLAMYTMKEYKFITNLTKEELGMIGKWKKKPKFAEWSKQLDVYAKAFKVEGVENIVQTGYDSYAFSTQPVMNAFLSYMLDYYKTNNRRPSRATLQYLAWKHGHMSNNYLINKWF